MALVPALRLPEMNAPKLDFPNVKVPDVLRGMDLSAISMPQVDLAATVTDVATAAGLRRPARRSRLPWVIAGLIVAGAATWSLMNSAQLRNRLRELMTSVHMRVSSMRSNAWDLATADPIAFPAAETKPIQPDPWERDEDVNMPDYPEGLGSSNGKRTPAQEESGSPV
jgi:hypothetical protein